MATAFLDAAQSSVERAIQRNLKGLGYMASAAPVLGASPKDVVLSRGPLRLYHSSLVCS